MIKKNSFKNKISNPIKNFEKNISKPIITKPTNPFNFNPVVNNPVVNNPVVSIKPVIELEKVKEFFIPVVNPIVQPTIIYQPIKPVETPISLKVNEQPKLTFTPERNKQKNPFLFMQKPKQNNPPKVKNQSNIIPKTNAVKASTKPTFRTSNIDSNNNKSTKKNDNNDDKIMYAAIGSASILTLFFILNQ